MMEVLVYLSSPGDVRVERDAVKQFVREFNADPTWRSRCALKVIALEDCVYNADGPRADLPSPAQADLFICVIRNRLGTPFTFPGTDRRFESATRYELEAAFQASQVVGRHSPRVLVFLGRQGIDADADDAEFEEYARARAFKKQLKASREYEGLVREYSDLSQFETLVRGLVQHHLDDLLRREAARRRESQAETETVPGDRPLVFISHSSADRSFVEGVLLPALDEKDVRYWYSPAHIETAADWEATIRAGLRSCDWFLVVLSPQAVASRWVRAEVHWALEHRPGKVVPVLYQACAGDDLHLLLRTIQHVDFRGEIRPARERLLRLWP